MVTCRECGAEVDRASAIGGVLQCPACGHVFESPPDAPRAPGEHLIIPHLSPPPGAQVQTGERKVVLVLPWHRDLDIVAHLMLVALWLLPLAGLLLEYVPLFRGVLTLGFSALMFYNWLLHWVNATTVVVGPSGMDISHGPLPSLYSDVTVPMYQLDQLAVVAIQHRSPRGNRWLKHQLERAPGQVLTRRWNRPETLDFVREVVNAVRQSVAT